MSNYSKIYWLTRLDYLQGFFVTMSVLAGLLIVVHFAIKMFSIDDGDDAYSLLNKTKRSLCLILCIFLALVSCFIPTKNEAILIMAGGKTLDYVQKDTSLSKVPYQTTAIISEYLDKTLKEMKSDKK